MKSRRTVLILGGALLAAAAVGMALYWNGRRPVTTSSRAAYTAYREALENEHRFYVKDARVGFARALALDPGFAVAMLGLARTSGDRDQALSLIDRAEREKPRLNELEQLQVDLAKADWQGKSEDLFRIAEKVHAKYPDDIRSAQMLAMQALRQGRNDRAMEIFAELLAVEPNNAAAYNQIGYYYAFRGDYDRAIENIQKYQFMAPDQANPYDSLGEIQAYSGHYDEAIANLKKALAIKPDFYESWGHLGVAYEGKGDPPQAIQSYEHAAADAVNDDQRTGFLMSALRVAARAKDPKEVRRIAGRVESLPKTNEKELNVAALRAVVALVEGRPADTERELDALRPKIEAAMRKYAGEKEPMYNAGWTWIMAHAKVALGKTDEAIALYRQMAEPPRTFASFPERRSIYEGRAELARLLAEKGDLDAAEKLLEANRRWNASWAPSKPAELAVAERRREKVLAASK